MKFFNLLTLVLFASSLFLGCNNDEEDIPKLDPEGDCMIATIDGDFFNGSDVKVVLSEDLGFVSSMNITGMHANVSTLETDILVISITRYQSEGLITPGTYSLDDYFPDIAVQYVSGPILSPENHGYSQGTLTIMTHDTITKRIEGKFEFEGENSQGTPSSIIDGYFDIKY
ncbi:MAG: hypothetical protein R2795_11485 [Saprospiraceae bacterium]